jgi:phosphoribosyl 1,2-cyclic phosphate phosphodiesterase
VRFTFLGTGTSSGIPCIGCTCAVCTSTDPRDTRLRCGAVIEFTDPDGHDRAILIDATPDLRYQALRHGLRRCDAILFTHNHVDHIFGLDEVRRFNAIQHAPIDILADQHTMTALRRVYAHVFERAANVNDSFVADVIPWVIRPFEPRELFGLIITPIRLLHGKLPILGYRFETSPALARKLAATPAGVPSWLPIAYCTDVSAIPPETWPHLRGLRTLALDALRHTRHPTHLTIDQAIDISQRLSPPPDRTLLIHIAHEVSHAQTSAQLPDGIELAYDGLTLT